MTRAICRGGVCLGVGAGSSIFSERLDPGLRLKPVHLLIWCTY